MQPHSKTAVETDMDIKSALNAVLPLSLRPRDKVERTIKSDSTTDRDANGQMPSGGEQQQGPMSDEQLQKALEHLRSLPVVKDHSLSVELIEQEGRKFVLIKEPNGKVVRRIHESELWSLQVVKSSEKGQLLRKTA